MEPRTKHLSRSERDRGLAAYRRHILWNGLGVYLLNHTVASLLAIHFGASNLQLGYITSAFHIAGLAALLVPRLLAGKNIGRVYFGAWMLRGVICLGYGALFFLEGQVAVVTVMVVFTAFAVTRAVGIAMVHPVQRTIVHDREAGGVVVGINIRLSITQMLSQLLSFLLLSVQAFSGLLGLVGLTYIGATMNTVAASYLRRIPSRETVEYQPGRGVIPTVREALQKRSRAHALWIHWLSMAIVVLFGFHIPYLRRVVGMPDNLVFLYMLFGGVASIAAGVVLKPFADTFGDRPIVILASVSTIVLALVWTILPGELPYQFYYAMGFATFFLYKLLLIIQNSVFVKSIPEHERISYSAMAQFFTAAGALVVGLIGGGLADLPVMRAAPAGLHMFSLTYLLLVVIAGANLAFGLKMRERGSLSLKESTAILLSAKNLKAFLDIYQLESSEDPVKREATLLSLERSDTLVATGELSKRLRSPRVSDRERVLRSLYSYPRPELLGQVLDEAQDADSYTQRVAIFALGAYSDPSIAPVLRELVANEEPVETVAVALKSLARIGSRSELGTVQRFLSGRSLPVPAELDLVVALSIMDESGGWLANVFTIAARHPTQRYKQAVYGIAARSVEPDTGLYELLYLENQEPGSGFRELLEEARHFAPIDRAREQLSRLYEEGRYTELSAIYAGIAAALSPVVLPVEQEYSAASRALRDALTAPHPGVTDPSDAVAALYFLYYLFEHSEYNP